MCESCDGKCNPRDHGIVEILDRNYGIEEPCLVSNHILECLENTQIPRPG